MSGGGGLTEKFHTEKEGGGDTRGYKFLKPMMKNINQNQNS